MSKLTREWKNLDKKVNEFAKPAFALGITSVFLFELVIFPILAIIFGAMGMNRAAALENKKIEYTGKALSTAGLVLGLVYLVCALYAKLSRR